MFSLNEHDKHNSGWYNSGMDINDPIVKAITSGGAAVITGTPQGGQRDGLYRVLEALGLMLSSSVSRKTQLLVACEDPQQRKIDRARELGVPICTEAQLKEAIAFAYTPEVAQQLSIEASEEALIYVQEE